MTMKTNKELTLEQLIKCHRDTGVPNNEREAEKAYAQLEALLVSADESKTTKIKNLQAELVTAVETIYSKKFHSGYWVGLINSKWDAVHEALDNADDFVAKN